MGASREWHTAVIKFLIELGAEVNVQNIDGDTALIIASRERKTWGAKLLIELGAEVNVQNYKGDTALIIASREAYIELAELLIEAEADVNVENNSGETALSLIQEKIEDAKRDSHYHKHPYGYIVKLLIEAGAKKK